MTEYENDIKEWLAVSQWLEKAKARELELRNKLTSKFLGSFNEGTKHYHFEINGINYATTTVAKINRKLIVENIPTVWAEAKLTADEANGLIEYKPELSTRVYKRLPPAKMLIVDKMIIAKPATPTLSIDILTKT
jgi:hypothetical protein